MLARGASIHLRRSAWLLALAAGLLACGGSGDKKGSDDKQQQDDVTPPDDNKPVTCDCPAMACQTASCSASGACVYTPSCKVTGYGLYDANADGSLEGAAALGGWLMKLTRGSETHTATTAADGRFVFDHLDEGDYQLCEAEPVQQNWAQTAPESCHSVRLPLDGGGGANLDFGNVCLGSGGAHGYQFWTQAESYVPLLGLGAALEILRQADLTNEDGSPFDPATYDELVQWLLALSSVNMAYKLGAEAAMLVLDTFLGYVDADALIWAPYTHRANALGFATVNDVLFETGEELAAHPYTPEGDPDRAYQEILARALAGANQNWAFVQSSPCAHSFGAEQAQ